MSFEIKSAFNVEKPTKTFGEQTMPQNSNSNKGTLNSKQPIIEFEHFLSFPLLPEETKKERSTNIDIKIKTIHISRTAASSSPGTPRTPSIGSSGGNWMWNQLDVTGPPSSSSIGGKWRWDQSDGKRTKKVSVTSTTSYESVSTIATDISPYIHLIHSDSFVRHRSGSKKQYHRKNPNEESRH